MTPKDEELMTRDDIIEIGRSIDPRAWLGIDKEDVDWCVTFAQLVTKKAVEAERSYWYDEVQYRFGVEVADEIRARSKT